MNQLDPSINKAPFSEWEQAVIVAAQAQAEFTNRWAQIARLLPRRTDNSIKNHCERPRGRPCAPMRAHACRCAPMCAHACSTTHAGPLHGPLPCSSRHARAQPAHPSPLRTHTGHATLKRRAVAGTLVNHYLSEGATLEFLLANPDSPDEAAIAAAAAGKKVRCSEDRLPNRYDAVTKSVTRVNRSNSAPQQLQCNAP